MTSKKESLAYIANIRLPTEKAHGLQIVKTCEAIAQQGIQVHLIIPFRKNPIEDTIEDFFAIKQNFIVHTVRVPELRFLGRWGFFLHTCMFTVGSLLWVMKHKLTTIYSRDYPVLCMYSFLGMRVFYEAHMGNWTLLMRWSFRRLSGIVCITKGLKNFYAEKGFSAEKIMVAPDAVDSNLFINTPSKNTTRDQLSLPQDKKIVLYSGSFSLYGWKGLDTFIKSASFFDDTFLFVAVGGYKKEVEDLRRVYQSQQNVIFCERVSPRLVPYYIKAADVLVLPNKRGDRVSEEFTSPMKLFEYMASGVPIVASDLPSIREIVDEECAILVTPDNPQAFGEGIHRALQDGGSVARCAKERAELLYTWDIRGKNIVNFIAAHV